MLVYVQSNFFLLLLIVYIEIDRCLQIGSRLTKNSKTQWSWYEDYKDLYICENVTYEDSGVWCG